MKADLEHAILELEARDATITELRLLEAAAEANRYIGTPPNEQDCPSSWRAGPGRTSSQPDFRSTSSTNPNPNRATNNSTVGGSPQDGDDHQLNIREKEKNVIFNY